MLLRRVLLDNETWFITAGILGMRIHVYHKDQDLTRKATRYERLYLLEILEHMKHSGVSIGPRGPEFEAIIQLFASEGLRRFVLGRWGPSGRGSVRWRI
jgi:hypothetical protein